MQVNACGFNAAVAWLRGVAKGIKRSAGIEVGELTPLEESCWRGTIDLTTGGQRATSESLDEIYGAFLLLDHVGRYDYEILPTTLLKHLMARNQAIEKLDMKHMTIPFASLTRLELQGNKLTCLPPDFAESLPNIEELYLGANQISKLPRFLDRRDEVQLDAPLSQAHEEIYRELGYPTAQNPGGGGPGGYADGEHAKSRTLWAACDKKALRSTFGLMPKLRLLWLNDNPLTSLPVELANSSHFPNLTQLCIDACDRLPHSLQLSYGTLSSFQGQNFSRFCGDAEQTRCAREWLTFDGLALAAVRRCVNVVLCVRKDLPTALSRLVQEFMHPSVGLEAGHPLHMALSLAPSFQGGRVLRSGRLVESRKRREMEGAP